MWPNGLPFPSILLETGLSESFSMLMADQEIWSEGTNYSISIIILVKIYKPNAEGVVTAKCTVTMYGSSGPTSVFAEVNHPLLKSTPTRLTWLCRLYFRDRRLRCSIFRSPGSKSIVKPSPKAFLQTASLPRSRRSETLITGFHNKEGLIRLNIVVDWSALFV